MPLNRGDTSHLKKVLEDFDSILNDPTENNLDAVRLFDKHYRNPESPTTHPFSPVLLWHHANLPLLQLLAGVENERDARRVGNNEALDTGDFPLAVKDKLRAVRKEIDASIGWFLTCLPAREKLQVMVQEAIALIAPPKGKDDDPTPRYRFVPTSTGYEIEYEGKKERFTLGGFGIIYKLLWKPGEVLTPSVLLGRDALPGDRCSQQPSMDYMRTVKEKMDDWRLVIEDPDATEHEKHEARIELDKLRQVVSGSTHRGKAKDLNANKAKSAFESVRNQLKRAYKKLAAVGLDDLRLYFEPRIKPNGAGYSYTTSKHNRIDWHLSD